MKNLKITPPEGYEIDREKSTFEEIIFKPMKKSLPKSWEELEKIKGYYVSNDCNIYHEVGIKCTLGNKNIFVTEAQAKATIALAQLSQLRDAYRDGWKPSWTSTGLKKYCIEIIEGHIVGEDYYRTAHFLSFQSEEIRDEFLSNFKDLIEEASPLLFG